MLDDQVLVDFLTDAGRRAGGHELPVAVLLGHHRAAVIDHAAVQLLLEQVVQRLLSTSGGWPPVLTNFSTMYLWAASRAGEDDTGDRHLVAHGERADGLIRDGDSQMVDHVYVTSSPLTVMLRRRLAQHM